MYRYISYIWMSIALMLVQIFLLDNITIHMWLRPMIFPIIVLLLPMEWRTIWVLLIALVVGGTMDLSLGGAGLYLATLLPLAMFRSTILFVTTNRSVEVSDQTTLFSRMSIKQLMSYVGVALLLHHAFFFILESLSFATPFRLVATIIFSSLLSLAIAWPIVRIFIVKIIDR